MTQASVVIDGVQYVPAELAATPRPLAAEFYFGADDEGEDG